MSSNANYAVMHTQSLSYLVVQLQPNVTKIHALHKPFQNSLQNWPPLPIYKKYVADKCAEGWVFEQWITDPNTHMQFLANPAHRSTPTS